MSELLASRIDIRFPRSTATHEHYDLAICVKVPQPPRIEHRLIAETGIADKNDCGATLGIKLLKCGNPGAMLRFPAKGSGGYGGVLPPFASDLAFPH